MPSSITSLATWIALLGINLFSGLPALISVVSACLGTLVLFFAVDYLATRDANFGFLGSVYRYTAWQKNNVAGFFAWRKLMANSRDIKSTQEKELLRLLRMNSNTEYSKKWTLDQVDNRKDFVKGHPLVKYSHFEEYFDRMIESGEEDIICSQTPLHYALTSGTTGKPSRIPILPSYIQLSAEIRAVQAYKVGPLIPANKNLSRRMKLYYNVRRSLEKSANGTLIGPATASAAMFADGDSFTTPVAGYEIDDEGSARYVHLLFGLHERNLRRIETYFSPVILSAFVDLEANWKDLVEDVRKGTLKSSLLIPDDIRHSLQTKLQPDPKRSRELSAEFSRGFKNIAKRIWPKLEVIECTTSGYFAHYADILRSQYTGDVLLWSNLYGSSEAFLGINLWPSRTTPNFLLWPVGVFLEFIALANVAETAPPTLFMDQVKIGEDYEIVLTTAAGLCRYRLGDILRVVDFINECPVVEFLYRSGALFSLKGEKVSEISMLNSLKEVVERLPEAINHIVDFTCCESATLEGLDVVGAPEKAAVPYYVAFVELNTTGEADMKDLEEKVEKQWDAALIRIHGRYAFYRNKGAIDHMKVYLLKPGAFAGLRNHILDTSSAAPAQMKMPKMLRKPELLRFVWNERRA